MTGCGCVPDMAPIVGPTLSGGPAGDAGSLRPGGPASALELGRRRGLGGGAQRRAGSPPTPRGRGQALGREMYRRRGVHPDDTAFSARAWAATEPALGWASRRRGRRRPRYARGGVAAACQSSDCTPASPTRATTSVSCRDAKRAQVLDRRARAAPTSTSRPRSAGLSQQALGACRSEDRLLQGGPARHEPTSWRLCSVVAGEWAYVGDRWGQVGLYRQVDVDGDRLQAALSSSWKPTTLVPDELRTDVLAPSGRAEELVGGPG